MTEKVCFLSLGGEGFSILLSGQSQQYALVIANRIKHRIDYDLRVKKKGGVNEPVTVSMGIYSLTEGKLNEVDFVGRADKTLCQAKKMTSEIALGSGRKARFFVLKDVVFCYCFELSKRCGYRLDEDLSVIVEWVMRVCEIKKSGEGDIILPPR